MKKGNQILIIMLSGWLIGATTGEVFCPQAQLTSDKGKVSVVHNGKTYTSETKQLGEHFNNTYETLGDFLAANLCGNFTLLGDIRSDNDDQYNDIPAGENIQKIGGGASFMHQAINKGGINQWLNKTRIVFYEGAFMAEPIELINKGTRIFYTHVDRRMVKSWYAQLMNLMNNYRKMDSVKIPDDADYSASTTISCNGETLILWNGRGKVTDEEEVRQGDTTFQSSVWQFITLKGDFTYNPNPPGLSDYTLSTYGLCFSSRIEEDVSRVFSFIESRGPNKVAKVTNNLADTFTTYTADCILVKGGFGGTCDEESHIEKKRLGVGNASCVDVHITEGFNYCDFANDVIQVQREICRNYKTCGFVNVTEETVTGKKCYKGSEIGGNSEVVGSLSFLSRNCNCTEYIPYNDPGASIIKNLPNYLDITCSASISERVSKIPVAYGAVFEVTDAKRVKRGAFCFIICFGFGQYGGESAERVQAINENDIQARNERVILFQRADKMEGQILILDENQAKVWKKVSSLEGRVIKASASQERINHQLLDKVSFLEKEGIITRANQENIYAYLENPGAELKQLINSSYVRDSKGCFVEEESYLESVLVEKDNTSSLEKGNITALAPLGVPAKIRIIPGVDLSSEGSGIVNIVFYIISILGLGMSMVTMMMMCMGRGGMSLGISMGGVKSGTTETMQI